MHEDFAAHAAELERRTIADLIEMVPEAGAELDQAVGYAIFANEATKVPVFGRGEGSGVAVDRRNDTRHFLSVTHFDVGGGLGRMVYRLVIVFFDADDFERLRTGTLHLSASIDAVSAGKTAGFSSLSQGKADKPKRAVYVLADSGATATWIVRLVRFKPLKDE
jgi:lipid-binding SYLF domain-containing protein